MRPLNCNVLSAVDTGSATGGKIDSNQLVSASFAAVFGDATAAGTVKIQASNDICTDGYQPATFTPTNWIDIPSATATISSGGSALILLTNLSYRWMRVVYTRSGGGSTTINVNMFALSV